MPEEIARLVFYLASDGTGFITGAAVPIDGGTTARQTASFLRAACRGPDTRGCYSIATFISASLLASRSVMMKPDMVSDSISVSDWP